MGLKGNFTLLYQKSKPNFFWKEPDILFLPRGYCFFPLLRASIWFMFTSIKR